MQMGWGKCLSWSHKRYRRGYNGRMEMEREPILIGERVTELRKRARLAQHVAPAGEAGAVVVCAAPPTAHAGGAWAASRLGRTASRLGFIVAQGVAAGAGLR